jgi:hypothetical protein
MVICGKANPQANKKNSKNVALIIVPPLFDWKYKTMNYI